MSHEIRRLSGSLRAAVGVPADLAFLLVATVVLDAAVVFVTGPARTVLAIPLLLFFPGYALVSLLFPGNAPESPVAALTDGGLDVTERFALGFGVSLAVVPLVGLALATGPWGIDQLTVVGAHSLLIVVASVVAVYRRNRLPKGLRFSLPYRQWTGAARRGVTRVPKRDAAVNVGLALAVVAALGVVGLGIASPLPREGYDSVSLMTQADDGSLVASDYPTEATVGESSALFVELENHHAEARQYTVVVQLQAVAEDGTVTRRSELDRLTSTVGAGESIQQRHAFTPTFAGEDLRLTYLVYGDDVPATPTRANADEEVHLWLTVTES